MARKCHNHEVQSSRGTKGMRDEEQIRTTQTHIKPQTHKGRENCNRATALERPVGKLLAGLSSFTATVGNKRLLQTA